METNLGQMARKHSVKQLEFRLRAKRWHTVATHFGVRPKRIMLSVWSARKCRWRRIGLIPGAGEFREESSVMLFNGVLQVQSPESRTLIRYDEE